MIIKQGSPLHRLDKNNINRQHINREKKLLKAFTAESDRKHDQKSSGRFDSSTD